MSYSSFSELALSTAVCRKVSGSIQLVCQFFVCLARRFFSIVKPHPLPQFGSQVWPIRGVLRDLSEVFFGGREITVDDRQTGKRVGSRPRFVGTRPAFDDSPASIGQAEFVRILCLPPRPNCAIVSNFESSASWLVESRRCSGTWQAEIRRSRRTRNTAAWQNNNNFAGNEYC